MGTGALIVQVEVERICEYPLDIILEEVDQKAVVVFGERDGIKLRYRFCFGDLDVLDLIALTDLRFSCLRYHVTGINGSKVTGTRFSIDSGEQNIFKYLEDESNFPVRFYPSLSHIHILRYSSF